jgi:Rieske [2Fe-2S] domain
MPEEFKMVGEHYPKVRIDGFVGPHKWEFSSHAMAQFPSLFFEAYSFDPIPSPPGTLGEGRAGALLVVHDGGKVFALDDRCPHLGFPLHRGKDVNFRMQ